MSGAIVEFLEDDLEGSSFVIIDIQSSLKLLNQHGYQLQPQ
jgi:hypothetical protein